MEYSTNNANSFSNALEGWLPTEKELASIVSETSFREGKKIVKSIKSAPPYKNRSGQLNRKNKVEKRGVDAIVFSNDATSKGGFPYAIPLHDGSGIYGATGKPITPKVAPYLHFFWHKHGRWVTTKSVRGVKPMKWFSKGWEKHLPKTIKAIFKEIKKSTGLKR